MKTDVDFLEFLYNLEAENEYSNKKVLIVDDDEDIFNWFKAKQKTFDENITFYYLADEMKILETMESFKPDLIILDLKLTNISGDRLGQMIRLTSFYKTPIVYMSSLKRHHPNVDIPDNHFLPKPLDGKSVNQKIMKLLKAS